MKRDVELLYELGMLRHLPRQWSRFGGVNFANLTEHHFRVAWTALVLAKHEGAKNTDKILKMALVHDVGESRTNDADYISRQYVERDEVQAVKDSFEGTSLAEEFEKLVQEYEERKTIEAKIVKDADSLDIDFEIQEQDANGIKIKGWLQHREHVSTHFFHTKTAKKLYKQIYASSPHDWHHYSPKNRINGGDWKKP